MPPYAAPRRGLSPTVNFLLLLGALVIGGGGTVAGLAATGMIDLPFLNREPSREGMVGVLMSGVEIPAYTRITRDHLINPETQQANIFWMPEQEYRPEYLKDLPLVAGRVLKRSKSAGYFFTEEDFFPKGTRPGISAGIPPGKRAFTVEAEKIQGLHNLQVGDRIDLVATAVPDPRKPVRAESNVGFLSLPQGAPAKASSEKAKVTVLVHNGAVVTEVTVRAAPITSSSLTGGTRSSTKPIQEIVLAIDPREVPLLTEALAMGTEIMAVARSGLPDSDAEEEPIVQAEEEQEEETMTIETIVGGERQTMVVPKKGKLARVASTSDGAEATGEARDGN